MNPEIGVDLVWSRKYASASLATLTEVMITRIRVVELLDTPVLETGARNGREG